jgi:EAL and modified HD-GYP domain-containing signal transduction protein
MAPPAFIARQPIFNHKLDVVGYELLFRGRGYAAGAQIDDAERATATVVLNTLTELDMNRIVAGKTAWINVTREFVLDDLILAVPPSVVGLEIPETEQFDEEMLDALRELKGAGYRLALDDFRWRDGTDAVLDLFDVVKLSMPELGRQQMRELTARLKPFSGMVLADKLGTRPDHEVCIAAGCDLFQGYFFCRPAVVGTRGITANRLALLQVVAALNDPSIELSDIEQLVVRDVALSFRLLRYVNSAFFGLRGDVRSIGQALALLGLENVRRWATLSTLATIDNKPTELTLTALIRARFCELAGAHRGIGSTAELFTLGLFSVIDGMMDAPMHDVVASLPLAEDMREALVQRSGPMGQLLDCVTELETGEDGPATATIPKAGEVYLEALMWANSAAESLFGEPGKAPAGTRAARSVPTSRRSVPAIDAAASTAPPVSDAVPAFAVGAPGLRPGRLRRVWARCLALLGRRVSEART